MGRSGKISTGSLLGNFQFGVFGVNKCDTEDDTFYCNFSRFFSMIMMLIVLCAILYTVYVLFKSVAFTSKRRGKN